MESLPEHHPGRSQGFDITQFLFMPDGVVDPPTQLCNWSIHVDFSGSDWESESDYGDQFDIEDESTWREWDDQCDRDLISTITEGLQANAFTTHQAEDLPIAIDHIVKTVSGSTEGAEVEAIGFAIMTRNVDALVELLKNEALDPKTVADISPLHLAAKFLDGSKTCCQVMNSLLQCGNHMISRKISYTDNLGLTVLDTLFISILRSHSSVTPRVLGVNSTAPGSLFEGADVDICGRWDADSPCVRHLHATGETTIPSAWKHVFCHTSAQAVCHCITAIFTDLRHHDTISTSGLFQKRCRCCGLRLEMGPLHAFVLVTFYLASAGMPGETLFGMLACLVCLLTFRADPSSVAEISIPAIFETGETDECQHRAFTAAGFASAVPDVVVSAWTPEIQLGWKAIKGLLDHCVERYNRSDIDGSSDGDDSLDSDPQNFGKDCLHRIHDFERELEFIQIVKCGDARLGAIWAAVQVELLTYRRLKQEDPWLSSMFDMRNVIEGLQANDESFLKDLVTVHGEYGLRKFSRCGLFFQAEDVGCARIEEACTTPFADFEDRKRTTFIPHRRDIF